MRLLMFKNRVFPIIIVLVLVLISCAHKTKDASALNEHQSEQTLDEVNSSSNTTIVVAANRTDAYIPKLKNKRVGVVANQTSVIFKSNQKDYVHLVDSLLHRDVDIKKVYAPEHGFRGTADAGEIIKDGIDLKTNLPIISLYGDHKKPSLEQLSGLDIMIFDIQDVGARFYTYISTLHYVMEACAEANLPLLILDRPNPNGHYVDGPILELKYQSFVGMHPIPVVHGMTIGEYAKMINGEGWLNNKVQCDLEVITMNHYAHNKSYSLPIKPSPNLPNDQAINLYPSLCFFEGTNVNAGRGTSKQFQIYGSPYLDKTVYDFKYIPTANEGSKYPKNQGMLCYGEDLSEQDTMTQINLSFLIRAYQNTIDKDKFFNSFFVKLAGTESLKEQIVTGMSEAEIKKSWQSDIEQFKKTRERYLIYE
ncbi:exo-beta-N-acetylmuramidase NamZ family protein [Psychroserpens sp. BH13MA-6]